MNIKHVLFIAAISSMSIACGQSNNSEEEQKEIEQLESASQELNEIKEEIEAETEDMMHDVDSLLNGI